jgi:hypothetical protein
MNQELWDKILAFDLDDPHGEYGFSIRLAMENFWTQEFTNQAIIEYKKFMYLAATSDFIVSPSKIIDNVWHQHLIFTQSYQDFCDLLGKQVQHIPSTRNKEEFEKFRQAKERTAKFYERDFGKQPDNYWTYGDMFESLHLEKAKYKLRSFIIFGILAFICLTVPAYFLLRPFYIHIDNPDFLQGFIVITVFAITALEFYNRAVVKNIVASFDKNSFIYNLQPLELVYLKTQKISDVIHGTVSELVENGAFKINADNSIEIDKTKQPIGISQKQVAYTLGGLKETLSPNLPWYRSLFLRPQKSQLGGTFYPDLLKELVVKPIFLSIPNSMDAFLKYFNKSKKFHSLFYVNFAILALLLLLAFTRIVTGTLRDKPVALIVYVPFALAIFIIFYLIRLTLLVSTTTIPNLYKDEILPARQIENNWQWSYFLLGSAVLATAFVPLVKDIEKNNDSGGSCGSSCGDCGGD